MERMSILRTGAVLDAIPLFRSNFHFSLIAASPIVAAMPYPSVDALQRALTDNVFVYATDRKKAAGRALGTLVEIITYYLLKGWGFRDSIAIERPLSEYANSAITHNVEYSLHPIWERIELQMDGYSLPLTASKIRKAVTAQGWSFNDAEPRNNGLLSTDGLLRNACTIAEFKVGPCVASIDRRSPSELRLALNLLHRQPFAIFECKRVGVEEGMKKGPQTIEKAKQGAYVARSISSLQKIRMSDGQIGGVIHRADGSLYCRPFHQLLEEVIASDDAELLSHFILSVGVVSNHGNWFTAEDHNKELRVLAQSYDWLLFLTDKGIAEFVAELLLEPTEELAAARIAFLASYNADSKRNRFTKVQIDADADAVLQKYFAAHHERIESWFNVITPVGKNLEPLRSELAILRRKNWRCILSP